MSGQFLTVSHVGQSRESGSQLVNGTQKQRRRVLVVDDSSDGRWMISSILKCLGMEVVVAASGREGCEAALSAFRARQPFDLVLMDWLMPEMDGCEATVRLRSAGYAGRIVALLSPSSFGQVDVSWQRSGCDGFASKPVTFEMLEGVIRRHVPEPAEARKFVKTGRARALAS